MVAPPANARIWIVAGLTNLRRWIECARTDNTRTHPEVANVCPPVPKLEGPDIERYCDMGELAPEPGPNEREAPAGMTPEPDGDPPRVFLALYCPPNANARTTRRIVQLSEQWSIGAATSEGGLPCDPVRQDDAAVSLQSRYSGDAKLFNFLLHFANSFLQIDHEYEYALARLLDFTDEILASSVRYDVFTDDRETSSGKRVQQFFLRSKAAHDLAQGCKGNAGSSELAGDPQCNEIVIRVPTFCS